MLFLFFLGFTLLSYHAVKGKMHGEGTFSISAQEAEKNGTIIARYYLVKDSKNTTASGLAKDELFLERIHLKEAYKYIYYSPEYYSDVFYINDNIAVVTSENDSLLQNAGMRLPIKSIPKALKVYSEGILIANYKLGRLYKDNIDKIPNNPIGERFSGGPLFDEYYN